MIKTNVIKPKVLLLQSTLSRYNVPVFNIIAKNTELTVAYTVNNECEEVVPFKKLKLNYKKVVGLFFICDNFYSLCKCYDVVVFLADLHYFSYCSLPFIYRKYKVIPWTIGFRSSYSIPYNLNRKKNLIDLLYGFMLIKSDAMIFYMKDPINYWGKLLNRKKIFIAPNTVEVIPNEIDMNQQKNRILFIGSLYKKKGIYELIDAYIEAKSQFNPPEVLIMDIIGEGDEYQNIKSFIDRRRMSDYVILHGAVYDEEVLAKIFSKSLVCISPTQAGLSVLKSMGYGVPFVTRANAITGGERLNIIDKENGVLYNSKEELINVIIDTFKNPEKYIAMGIEAHKYYNSYTTTNHMAKGFLDAIKYVL